MSVAPAEPCAGVLGAVRGGLGSRGRQVGGEGAREHADAGGCSLAVKAVAITRVSERVVMT